MFSTETLRFIFIQISLCNTFVTHFNIKMYNELLKPVLYVWLSSMPKIIENNKKSLLLHNLLRATNMFV